MITGVVIGRENIPRALRSLPGRIDAELRKEIEGLAIKLTRKVKADKLTGSVLKNRTGTLRASINYRLTSDANSITATVGTNKEYAAVHEYGFNGVVNVREHLRMMVKAFGVAVKNPKAITVRAHSRHMVMPERSFLRSSLREMNGEIRERIIGTLRRLANG